MMVATALACIAMTVNTSAAVKQSWTQTLVIGHRGAAAYQPENTLPSFEEAIRCKAVATECDVHVSKDGKLAVIHDGTLDRTTSLKGAVKDHTMAEMSAAGVPSLPELTRTTRNRIVLVVEIKDGEDVERKVVDHLKAEKMKEQTVVFSFGSERIEKVESLDRGFFTVWLVGKKLTEADYPGVIDKLREIRADGLGLSYQQATPEIVKLAHAARIPVFVWTVPPGPEVDRLKSLKVNFIITNHPRDVREQLAR